MPDQRRKVKRFVIDVNTYLSIFINREEDWLLGYITQNRIEIFIDDHLINELKRVLKYPKIKKLLSLHDVRYIDFVRSIGIQIIAKRFQVECPDPDDNYLFDLALTSHSKILVTGDLALLKWERSPVDMLSLLEFKKLF